ncbi:hypothetical protein Ddye_014618 [Dipteronia dyeriana]|uniref:Cytochrome P450 n=1 Tax=Dipteronia dyeriana TaxID=168575 RepID=A0AAE0CKR1_9ROSI|nr:hypothetical protein Ddye_014618 [Dipteronia dyeriana]
MLMILQGQREIVAHNLMKYPAIQEKLFMEMMKEVLEVREEDLQTIPYVKAVILEGLRRHPPSHFLLPHAVTRDTVPKDGVIAWCWGKKMSLR